MAIRHPPYSSDLAPADFWLFGYLKRELEGQPDFEEVADLEKAVTKTLNSIPANDYRKAFDDWLQRMQLCIQHKGDYFEHFMH